MSSVTEHYERHLAAIYLWMTGGMDAAVARGQAEMGSLVPRTMTAQRAVDLGAGFGMHSIPLADLGYSVLAIDSSEMLLEVLRGYVGTRSVTTLRGDLTAFKRYVELPVAVIVCMGDTLTHLPDRQTVEQLFADVADCLQDGGTFIATFRDYSVSLSELNRFIAVRSDADRILTCFLEYEDVTVTVHDIIHERDGPVWRQRISAYRKLRLSTDWVIRALEANGFQVKQEPGPAGMARLMAKRPHRTE
jgi:2-polyprenyl-3-methyl-5-hydroxy-6-metoxy-1,4-benzoquinol methylase